MKKIIITIVILSTIVITLYELPDCQRHQEKVVQVVYGSNRSGEIITSYILENGRQDSEYGIVNVGDIKNVCN